MRVGSLKLKLQIVCGDRFAVGPGKAEVLEAIDREGSISAAGRSMGMSYRRIWLLVDEMNRCFAERLVETQAGGGSDRGAHLTTAGRAVLAAFRELEQQAMSLTESDPYRRLIAVIRPAPVPPKE